MAVETPIQVLLLIYPSFNTLDLNGPLDVLKNPYLSADSGISPLQTDAFDITIAAASPLTTSYEGVAIHRSISLSQASENLSNYDILIQTGGTKESIAPHLTGSDELILLAQKFSLLGYSPRLGDTRIMMSICTGALFFGYAGIFAGLEATTHIHFLDDLKNVCQEYNVRVPG
jgi:transcriptional regulator GlxA family with amidase domain